MATYYVDPSGPNGSGTESSPFNALPANFSSAGYVNGDIFLFKRGTTYTPAWANTPGTPGDAFTVNRSITFGAYGAGERPIISSNYTGSAGGRLFRIYNTGCVFEDIHFDNTNNCHIIYGSGFADLTVRRCKATNIRGSSSGNEGFVVMGASSALTGTVVVTDNEVDGICNDGIEVRCTGTTIVARNTVKNCSLDTTTGDCLAFPGDCAFLHVYDNVLDHTNKDTKQCIIQDGGTSTGFALIEGNILNGYFAEGSVDHTGLYISLPGIVRRNFIKTWRSGLFVNAANITVQSNVIIQGGGTALTGAVWGTFAGMVVESNTMLRMAGTDVADAAIRNNTSNATNIYRNNIISGFNTGIRRGALAVDSYNAFSNVDEPVRDASNVPVAAGTGSVEIDLTNYLNSDGSLRMPGNPLATAGTYVQGVTLANGRLRPGYVPIGAYMAVQPRAVRV